MDVLERERLVADTVYNRLARRKAFEIGNNRMIYVDDWFIPLIRSASKHVYVPIDRGTCVYFTRTQLHKLHRQFFYPSADKLFNLILRARPEARNRLNKNLTQRNIRKMGPLSVNHPGPVRFRVSFGAENVRFNERIIIDIMYIESWPVLHIVDDGTRFSAAQILFDQGTQFGKMGLYFLAARSNVQVESTGTEFHSSLGIGERIISLSGIRSVKCTLTYPSADKSLLLQLSVKAMNDTLGPEGLVPSSLVFGEYPKVYTPSETREVDQL
eukprot:IDg19742t1